MKPVIYNNKNDLEEINDKNVLKRMVSTIDYNTYNNIKNALRISAIGLIASEIMIGQNSVLYDPINIIFWTCTTANILMSCTKYKYYTKDIIQIKELYQEFLKNYNKLNKMFDFDNPIQIYIMFDYLLHKGFLSKDKIFEFTAKQSREIGYLKGVNVIAGKAVCRHISAMLSDILNNYGIESYQLGVLARDFDYEIIISDEPKCTKEELMNWAKSNLEDETEIASFEELLNECSKINKYISVSTNMVQEKNILNRIIGNHAITFAFNDGKKYFLDPTNSSIYRIDNLNKNLLCNNELQIPIKSLVSITLNNSLKRQLQMRKLFKSNYPCASLEEEQIMSCETTKICDDNIDVFESFYKENAELYNDISSKVLKIKKDPFLNLHR